MSFFGAQNSTFLVIFGAIPGLFPRNIVRVSWPQASQVGVGVFREVFDGSIHCFGSIFCHFFGAQNSSFWVIFGGIPGLFPRNIVRVGWPQASQVGLSVFRA